MRSQGVHAPLAQPMLIFQIPGSSILAWAYQLHICVPARVPTFFHMNWTFAGPKVRNLDFELCFTMFYVCLIKFRVRYFKSRSVLNAIDIVSNGSAPSVGTRLMCVYNSVSTGMIWRWTRGTTARIELNPCRGQAGQECPRN